MITKEQAKINLTRLVAKFKSEFEAGKTDAYTEESTKKSFIEPLLEDVLGWDVTDHDEVTMEHRVSRDRVDYGIKIRNKLVFFVEAKPIKYDLDKAIPQAVKYCYNKKDVPFVMLTDFEGLMFFDAGFKPDLRYVKRGLKIDLNWKNYEEKFDELWQLSKAEVEVGSLDKLITQKSKDRTSVDKDILEDLEKWREKLAKSIYKNNLDLFHTNDRDSDSQYLKEITQKLLDRIIFIRFCEDKQLTQMQQLKPRFDSRGEDTGLNTMYVLRGIFKEYEAIFNSDLFATKDWEDNLKIDFNVVNKIIQQTYDPYMFDAIPLEILGNIYEQYLGYTIKLAGDSIKYELKPEVRKAGGVYYTPEYIVSIIVGNTIGKFLVELSEAKAKKIRILDPACGSGTFLIRAYDEMLKYYLNLKKRTKALVAKGQTAIETGDAGTKLTIEEKTRILKDHIFGVDLDDQSVEVTKLSLMLKMLEGEDGFVKGTHLLPMLKDNIRCGNSLVSGNTLELNKYFGSDFHKAKPFNWREEFKKIFNDNSGFDIIVGNPPWGSKDILDSTTAEFLSEKFKRSLHNLNIFALFVDLSMEILSPKGSLGFLIPKNFIKTAAYKPFRKDLLVNNYINCVMDFGQFPGVAQEAIALYVKNEAKDNYEIERFKYDEKLVSIGSIQKKSILEDEFCVITLSSAINFVSIIKKMNDKSFKLGSEFKIIRGMEHGRNGDLIKCPKCKFYSERPGKKNKKLKFVLCGHCKGKIDLENEKFSHKFINKKKIKSNDHPLLIGNSIDRYALKEIPYYVELNLTGIDYKKLDEMNEKLLFIRIAKTLRGYLDVDGVLCLNALNIVYKKAQTDYDLKYVLGILNSKLYEKYADYQITSGAKLTIRFSNEIMNSLPIPKIDFNNAKEKQLYSDMIELVKVILDLNKKMQTSSGSASEQIELQISKIDNEINNVVYKLYGITENERIIIEA
jgi:type I restriction-modification system DNA methylase subunit